MKKVLLALLSLLLVTSCTMEIQENSEVQKEGNYLSIDIDSRATTSENGTGREDEIVSVRVIIIAKDGKWENRVTCNELIPFVNLVNGNIARVWVRSGRSDIYLLLNEAATDKTKLEAITNRKELNAFNISAPAADVTVGSTPIPMWQQFIDATIKPYPEITRISPKDDTEKATRLWAKVRIRFKAADVAGVKGMIMKSLQHSQLPEFIYPISRLWTDAAEGSYTWTLNATPLVVGTYSKYCEYYIPEYLIATGGTGSVFTIVGTTPAPDSSDQTYTLPFPFTGSLERNTIYEINCTVKGYADSDMTIKTNVLPWNKANSNPDVGGFMKVSNLEYIILDRPLQMRDIQVAKVSHNLEGEHKNVVTAMGDGLTLQGTLDPTDSKGGTVLPDAADLPKSVNHAVVEKFINVNLSETFTSGTVKIDMGGQFRQNVKITRAPYLAQKNNWERYELGTGIVYVDPTGINNEWIKVSNSSVFSIYMLTISGPVSKTAPLYVYINRSVVSGSTGVGLNIVRETDDAKKETVRCSYALPRMNNLLIARRDLIGRLPWTDAMTGTDKGCKTLGTGWRVPTQTELIDIETNKENIVTQVGGKFLPDFFWSATDGVNSANAVWVSFYSDDMDEKAKTEPLSVRCVYDY